MLIFDNVIFASFIPQLLMFLGIVSCVTESYLAPFLQNNTKEKHQIVSSENSGVNQGNDYSIVYFEDCLANTAFPLKPDNEKIFFEITRETIYPVFNQNYHLSEYYFEFFSRPPPFFA